LYLYIRLETGSFFELKIDNYAGLVMLSLLMFYIIYLYFISVM